MGRREYPARFTCAQPGCRQQRTVICEGRDEYNRCVKDNTRRPWKCSRHENPVANLRPGNEATRRVLIARRIWHDDYPGLPGSAGWLPGQYWLPEGRERGGSGFEHGPGFNAYAADFPEGTRLVVEARIELPAREVPADG